VKCIRVVSRRLACAFVVLLFTTAVVGQLIVSPSPVSFGSVQLGGGMSKSVTLANSGNSKLTISQANISGTGFSFSSLSLPMTLNPGQATNFVATFTPQSAGSITGSLSLAY
jgi:hypothetical protein